MTTILDRARTADLTDYRPVPFWSWNDRLQPAALRAQIRAMRDAGMGGFFMHARGGLETEYMSDEWFAAVDASVDEAAQQHMNAWCYDENGWPSGFAGGKLLEDPANWAHFLKMERKTAFDPDALAVYVLSGTALTRVTADCGTANCGAAEYICVYDCTNASTVDILNPDVMDRFIAETHDRYYARFADAFGNTLKGFFTDEPQYFRYATAYSPTMIEAYRARYGGDLLDELGRLFVDCDGAPGFRFRYWQLMNERYTEQFAGRIFRWCESHRAMLTGHTIQEDSLGGQMICSAGVMPFYEYEHIPGIDWLGRITATELGAKQVGSAAAQLGKKHVLTETFACCGWDVTPRELKRIAEWQYVNGVNLMCHHLYPYSIRGQRKRDYPAFYSAHNPWTDELRPFNDYFTHLGYLLAESEERANVGVLHAMHSAYLTFDRADPEGSTGALNKRFTGLLESLGAAGIGHHLIDEYLLRRHGSVSGRRLCMGRRMYDVIVIPEMDTIDRATAELLREYVANGGEIVLQGAAPTMIDGEPADLRFLRATMDFDALCRRESMIDRRGTAIRCTYRSAEGGDFWYAVNLSPDKTETLTVTLPFRGAVSVELTSAAVQPVHFVPADGGIRVPLTLAPGESVVLMQADDALPAPVQPRRTAIADLTGTWTFVQRPENTLTLDTVALSDDGVTYSEPLPVMAAADRLLRQRRNRKIWLRYTFRADYVPQTLLLEAERADGVEITVNGQPAVFDRPGTLDPSFRRADIAPLTRAGGNEIVMQLDYVQSDHVYDVFNGFYYGDGSVTETLINCLSYETNIEAVYLAGDFTVTAIGGCRTGAANTRIADAFTITPPSDTVRLADLTTDGFPFLHGAVTLRTTVTLDDPRGVLRLDGRYQYAKAWVNGAYAGLMLFGSTLDITALLHAGENQIELELMGSNRNLFGPHHVAGNPEPTGVSPRTFELFGRWDADGHCDSYDPSYAFVRFGLDVCVLER